MKMLKLAAVLAVGLAPVAALASPSTICPTLSGTSFAYKIAGGGCNDLITISATNVLSITTAGQNPNPFDGSDDQIVGVQNNGTSSISSLTLTGAGIFGFDGDGIVDLGGTGNASDHSNGGYGGPDAFFSNIVGNTGVVNFLTPIAPGGTAYFSLESAPNAGGFTGVVGSTPEPSSLILLGTGVLGAAASLRRRFIK